MIGFIFFAAIAVALQEPVFAYIGFGLLFTELQ